MVKKGIKVLTGIAIALQVLVVIGALLIVANQRLVMELFAVDLQDLDTVIIPVSTLAGQMLPLICLGIFGVVVFYGKQITFHKKAAAVVSIAVYALLPLIFSYVGRAEYLYIAHTSGVMALAGCSTITSAISLLCTPFSTGAFALFALAAGGYIWSGADRA